jgi:hypothetical protein
MMDFVAPLRASFCLWFSQRRFASEKKRVSNSEELIATKMNSGKVGRESTGADCEEVGKPVFSDVWVLSETK